MKISAHPIIQKSRQNPSIKLFTNISLYNYMHNTHSLKTNIYHFIHYNPSTKSVASSIIMSAHIYIWKDGWHYLYSVSEHRDLWPHITRTKDLGRYLKCQKCSEVPLIDNHPRKSIKI